MNTENWKWFRLPQIFSRLQKCKCTNATELLEEGTDIAYIGAKKNGNGVMQYVQYNANLVTKGNCIVLIGDGQGSVGYSLYQPNDFIGSTTLIAGFAERLNPYTAQFLVAIIDQDRYRYSFGRKFNLVAINNTRIKLPATTNAKGDPIPDWQWMEDYAKNTLLPQLPEKARQVWEKKYNNQPLSTQKLELKTDEWKWFKIGDLFQEIYKAKAHVKQEINITNDATNGLIFVSRTETNNGCDVFVERDDSIVVEAGNAIIIGDTTATCFYQEKKFTTGDHIIVCRSNWLNKSTALFFKTIMDNEKYRFNYGRAFKMELVREHRIKLPATTNKNGETVPDWQWMEDYIKGLPYSGAI